MKDFDFDEWVKFGWEKGWCSPPVCSDCDGVPMSEEEETDELGVCAHVIRLYESEIHKRAVEKNSPPAVWRASNRGWVR